MFRHVQLTKVKDQILLKVSRTCGVKLHFDLVIMTIFADPQTGSWTRLRIVLIMRLGEMEVMAMFIVEKSNSMQRFLLGKKNI